MLRKLSRDFYSGDTRTVCIAADYGVPIAQTTVYACLSPEMHLYDCIYM